MCDLPKVFVEREVRARKSHRCSECEHPIEPGAAYWKISGLWDYSWSSHRQCVTCRAIFRACSHAAWGGVGDYDGCGPCYGELANYIEDVLGGDWELPPWAWTEDGWREAAREEWEERTRRPDRRGSDVFMNDLTARPIPLDGPPG